MTDDMIFISIHALLAESDSMSTILCCGYFDFYPRSPCGERHNSVSTADKEANFYPRSPCGERRMQICFSHAYRSISIHALLAESDLPFAT